MFLVHAFLFLAFLFHNMEYIARRPLIPTLEAKHRRQDRRRYRNGNKSARPLVLPVGGYFEENDYSRSSEGRYRPPRISTMHGMGRHGRGMDYRRRYGELTSLRSGAQR